MNWGKLGVVAIIVGVTLTMVFWGEASLKAIQTTAVIKDNPIAQPANNPTDKRLSNDIVADESIETIVDAATPIDNPELSSQHSHNQPQTFYPPEGLGLQEEASSVKKSQVDGGVLRKKPLELEMVSNQLMMSFTESFQGYSRKEKEQLLAPFGVKILKEYQYAGNSVLLEITTAPTSELGKLPAGEAKEQVHRRIDAIVKQLEASHFVRYAEPNTIVQIDAAPTDPRYSELWGLENMQAEQAWDYVEQNMPGPTDIIVGVIDTGVDYTHPDLAANMWVNTGEVAGDGIDNDGNGYIDDVHGWDARNHDGDPMDDHSHGTHVAGTIGAVRDNGEGVVGITPHVKIMALKMFDAGGNGTTSHAVELLNYIHQMKQEYGVDIRLTNNSWGGDGADQSLLDAIAVSHELNILFVAAAGNNARDTDAVPYYPQSYDVNNVISVGSITSSNTPSGFSNYGVQSVDIHAPGSGILSTIPNNAYGIKSGTSMAAPHVSGALAFLLAADPSLTIDEVKNKIFLAADKRYGLQVYNAHSSQLNLNRAVQPSLIVVSSEKMIIEEGAFSTLDVRLSEAIPDGDSVSVTYSLSVERYASEDHFSVDANFPLVFTSENWDQWQTITINAEEDINGFNDVNFLELLSNVGISPYIELQSIDNDEPTNICHFNTDIPVSECEALYKIYESMNGGFWGLNSRWFKDPYPCSWQSYFLRCEDGHIVQIWNVTSGFYGELPPEIEDLTELKTLILERKYNGKIPKEIGHLTKLEHIDFSKGADNGHQIVGGIPPEIGQLSNLKVLKLGNSGLTGSIPPEIGDLSNLEELHIESNQLQGNFPREIYTLTNLRLLLASNNQLGGQLSSEMGGLINLEGLNLNGNSFDGDIPAEIGNMVKLKALQIGNNNISGELPSSIGNLLDLEFVVFDENALTGVIPPEMGNLSKLRYLSFHRNQLSGPLPQTIGNLTNLTDLRFNFNQLSGAIPPEIGNLENLLSLGLGANNLEGEIPSELGQLTTLRSVWLNGNRLEGAVPSGLFNAKNLGLLQIQGNNLHGEIPEAIMDTALTYFTLDYNALQSDHNEVIDFLSTIATTAHWDNTQTVAPSDISISQTDKQLTLSWSPIPYQGAGGYIIHYADNAHGPFIEHGRTTSKSVTDYIVGDAEQHPGRYYAIQAYTSPHTYNENEVVSLLSRAVVYDPIPPSIVAPDDLTVEATSTLTEVNLGVALVNDNFDTDLEAVADNTGPFAVGTHRVIWRVTDRAGNTATAGQTVTIQDTTAPSLLIPSDITLEATAALTSVNLGSATATDIVDGMLPAIPSTAGPFSVGVHSVVWRATDDAANTAVATQTVTIQDTTAPVIDSPPVDLVVEAINLQTPVALGTVTATDLVGGSITATPDRSGPFPLGSHMITWTATDGAGNTATTTQNIIVEDTTPPVIDSLHHVFKASADGEPVWHWLTTPTVTDATSVTFTHNQPDMFVRLPTGVTTVEWTATDSAGNQSTAAQQIDVVHLAAANLLTPTENTLLNGDTVFTWEHVEGAQYSLEIGTEVGGNNLFSQHMGSAVSVTVSDLPQGVALFVRLKTHLDAYWTDWYVRAAYNDYLFNTVDPAVAYYPRHSGLMACEAQHEMSHSAQNQGDIVWVLNPDNDAVSILNVSRDPDNYELLVDAQNDFFFYTNSKPSSISRVEEFVAVTYADTGYIRFNHIAAYQGGTVPWTTWLLTTETGERPVASVAYENFLYVALYGSGEVIKIDVIERAIVARLTVGPKPKAMALTADGSRLLVTRYISSSDYGEVYDINTAGDMSFRDPNQPSIRIHKVAVPDATDHGSGVPNYLRGIVIDKDNHYAYVTANKSNVDRGLSLSGEPLGGDNTVRSMIAIIDLQTHQDINVDATTREGTIDLQYAADPSAVSFLPDGVTRVDVLQGNNQVELVNTQNNNTVRLNVGGAPQSVCHTPNTLYVKNYTTRSVTVIDTASYLSTGDTTFSKVAEVITVPADEETLSAQQLLGLQLFHHARQPDLSPQGTMSCASCHQDGGHDGMTWDFSQLGEGLRNTLSLNGNKGTRFGVLNWSGHADEIQDVEKKIEQLQGGEGLIPGTTFTHEAGHEITTTGASGDLDAIAAYLSTLGKQSLMYSPNYCGYEDSNCLQDHWNGYNTLIGYGCLDCHKKNDTGVHSGGIWKDGLTHDMGTMGLLSGGFAGEALTGIRTPTLAELWDSAPYLHDGSAETLHEVMNIGVHATYGMGEEEIDRLIDFLNRLGRIWYIEDDALINP